MFSYTRAQLKSDINTGLTGKIGMIASLNDFINRVVRETKNQVALRSAKRKQSLSPDLFEGENIYACPADLQDNRIIDIPAQAKNYENSFGLVAASQFRAGAEMGDIAVDDFNGQRVLLINSNVTTSSLTLDTTNALTNWVAFGQATNLTIDQVDFIKGHASLTFDLSATPGTTAGVQNASIAPFDLTPYLQGNAAVFVWAKINNPTDLTSYTMRLGTDAANYYSKTVTSKFDGIAFVRGWNLLRFDLSGLTETGIVTDTSINFLALFMTKASGKISEAGYKFNYPVLKTGVIHDIYYYSKYGWQDENGVYKESSTDDGDLLVADQTEYDLFVKKGVELGLPLVNADVNQITMAKNEFMDAMMVYGPLNPDESQIMVSTYHNH